MNINDSITEFNISINGFQSRQICKEINNIFVTDYACIETHIFGDMLKWVYRVLMSKTHTIKVHFNCLFLFVFVLSFPRKLTTPSSSIPFSTLFLKEWKEKWQKTNLPVYILIKPYTQRAIGISDATVRVRTRARFSLGNV